MVAILKDYEKMFMSLTQTFNDRCILSLHAPQCEVQSWFWRVRIHPAAPTHFLTEMVLLFGYG